MNRQRRKNANEEKLPGEIQLHTVMVRAVTGLALEAKPNMQSSFRRGKTENTLVPEEHFN